MLRLGRGGFIGPTMLLKLLKAFLYVVECLTNLRGDRLGGVLHGLGGFLHGFEVLSMICMLTGTGRAAFFGA